MEMEVEMIKLYNMREILKSNENILLKKTRMMWLAFY